MSLFMLIRLCFDGEEETHPGAICLVEEGTDSEFSEIEKSTVASPESKAYRALKIKQKSIFSSPLEADECRHAKFEVYPKTAEDELLLKNVFLDQIFFEDLGEAELAEVISAMETIKAKPEDELDVEYLYVVQSGSLLYFSGTDSKVPIKLSDGELLCDVDFMYGTKSSNDSKVVVEIPSTLWRIHHLTHRSILAKHALQAEADVKASLRKVELFNGMTENAINKFIDSLTKVSYKAGERIITKGEIGEIFYIIEEGRVRTHDIGFGDSQLTDVILERGDSFGERALLTGEPRIANITAITDVTALVMDRTTFNESLGEFKDRMNVTERLHALKSLSIFSQSDVTELELERLAEKLVEVCYKAGTKLVNVGSPYPPNLWMIRSGKLLVYGTKSDTIYKMQGGGYFGDKSILNPVEHISSHDATCETNLTAYLLTREDIISNGIHTSRLGGTTGLVRRKNLKPKIRMEDLKKHRVLGQGGFGTVWLCTSRNTRGTYALKIINKRQVLQQKQERGILREKELLEMLDHPFILNMVSCFQDKVNCYFLLPVIQGGELFTYLSKHAEKGEALPVSDVAFYALQIIEGLGHFHHRFIAYRDLKLENVMIDADGYIKIVDLGFAKIVMEKSYTICGTPDYMAPEIIMSRGHNCAVDYWSYGVLLYELLFGFSPFKKNNETQIQLFKRIVSMDYSLPEPTRGVDAHLVLIKGLLTRNVVTRIGNLKNGYIDIRDHRFFKEVGVDVKKLLRKELEPPWIPTVTNPLDSQNFDDFSNLEAETTRINGQLTSAEQSVFASF